MSRIIEVEKAFRIVKECCSETNPPGQIIQAVTRYLDDVAETVSETIKPAPLEAGMRIMPGPVVIVKVVKDVILGRVVLPIGAPLRQAKVQFKLDDVIRMAESLRGIQEKLKRLDFCSDLLECVARSFRRELLPQRNGPRSHFISQSFASHFIPAGSKVPRKEQRHVRP